MKLIRLAVVLCFCSSVVLAETTLEIIQQRAESGDATAQTLLGLMAQYGCDLPKNDDVALEWFQKAASQGDAFARKKVAYYEQKPGTQSSAKTSSDNKVKKPASNPSGKPSLLNVEEKVSNAGAIEYLGRIDLDELFLNREKCVGKVVKLAFRNNPLTSLSVREGKQASLLIRGKKDNGILVSLRVSGQEALEWAMSVSKNDDVVCSAYVLVDATDLIALGTEQRKEEVGYQYKW